MLTSTNARLIDAGSSVLGSHWRTVGKKKLTNKKKKPGCNTFMCWVCQNKPTNRLYKAAMSTKNINLISNTYGWGKSIQIQCLFFFPPSKYSLLKQRISR